MPADSWPERRNGDLVAKIESLERQIQLQAQILESLDSKMTSLVQHIMTGFELVADGNKRPYSLRDGLDDASAARTRSLLWLRDAAIVAEAELARENEIMGEIRNGKYQPEKPAKLRRATLGDSWPDGK